ncbi:hypothetical protein ACOKGD_13910 [Microbacterium phosphatis]|uniref:hypothetical protein n=1 Tax=Microbacterium phosphatis TaxID=3140248 RepID=UPI003140B678
MAHEHQWKRLPNPPRDRVQCTVCGVYARAIAPFRTGADAWQFELEPTEPNT